LFVAIPWIDVCAVVVSIVVLAQSRGHAIFTEILTAMAREILVKHQLQEQKKVFSEDSSVYGTFTRHLSWI